LPLCSKTRRIIKTLKMDRKIERPNFTSITPRACRG